MGNARDGDVVWSFSALSCVTGSAQPVKERLMVEQSKLDQQERAYDLLLALVSARIGYRTRANTPAPTSTSDRGDRRPVGPR